MTIDILHEVNMVARQQDLIYVKRNQESESNAIIDPDKFPINRLSADLITEYESVWTTEYGKKMLRQVERYVGHTLQVKESEIDHHLSGNGVFLSCKR